MWSMGFVTADYLKFSDDIEKIYLSKKKASVLVYGNSK